MTRKQIELHKLRYPSKANIQPPVTAAQVKRLYEELANLKYSRDHAPFLRWFTENEAALESPLFKSYYSVKQEQEIAADLHYTNLRTMTECYAVSIGLLGGWLSFLCRSHADCHDTIHLTETFLLEISILETVFLAVNDTELQTAEYRTWIQRHPRRALMTAEQDKAYVLHNKWLPYEADADKFQTDARSRVKREDLSDDHITLKREEAARLSEPHPDLKFDRHRSLIIQDHIKRHMWLQPFPPLSIESINDALNKWDETGRHRRWEPIATREIKESERRMAETERISAAHNSEDDEDYATKLWGYADRWHQHATPY